MTNIFMLAWMKSLTGYFACSSEETIVIEEVNVTIDEGFVRCRLQTRSVDDVPVFEVESFHRLYPGIVCYFGYKC